jgi:putative N6-adenine-specific DNA methylase
VSNPAYADRMENTFEIFVVATPGFEDALLAEAQENGFPDPQRTQGGVLFQGTWEDVWRANLVMRGATRILARIGSFMAFHLAQLDKRARKFPWGDILRVDVPVRVEVSTSKKSKIYHAGAATQRIETALKESHGITISADAEVVIKTRIDDNRVTISVDTSGESLHKRGHKEAVGKAPMRETLAALMLRECGYDGSEPVLDPMCGSGTFLIEAAEIAGGFLPGRTRDFAFMKLANFDAGRWSILRKMGETTKTITPHFYGSDRDAGAVRMSRANAEKAGVSEHITFENMSANDIVRPDGPPGLIICNPPYGGRIGNAKLLYGLYGTLGETLKDRFSGWRVGVVTSEAGLAKATGLPFKPKGPAIPHGGLKVWLFQTDAL